jgi:hypothetical protein
VIDGIKQPFHLPSDIGVIHGTPIDLINIEVSGATHTMLRMDRASSSQGEHRPRQIV